jgi:putative hydrolase of the HAD superfamily
MTVKAVLFDMFDTLMLIKKNHDFYSPSLVRMYKFLFENGVNAPFEKFKEAYDQARDELYSVADLNLEEPHFNVRTSLTLKKLGYSYDAYSPLIVSASAVFCEEFMKYVSVDENAEGALHNLSGKYKLGIISNYVIPECVYELLKNHDLNALFDVVVVSGAVNKRKPSPEIFNQTLNALGVSAAETVFVGDTMDADVEGPKAVGMKTIYIKRRNEKQDKNVQPDATITSLKELPMILKRL